MIEHTNSMQNLVISILFFHFFFFISIDARIVFGHDTVSRFLRSTVDSVMQTDVIVTNAETRYSNFKFKNCLSIPNCESESTGIFKTSVDLRLLNNVSLDCSTIRDKCFYSFKNSDLNKQSYTVSINQFTHYNSFLIFYVDRIWISNQTEPHYQPTLRKARKDANYLETIQYNNLRSIVKLTPNPVDSYESIFVRAFEVSYQTVGKHFKSGSLFVMRRERINNGQWKTRLGITFSSNPFLFNYNELILICSDNQQVPLTYAENAYFINEKLYVTFNKYSYEDEGIDSTGGVTLCVFKFNEIEKHHGQIKSEEHGFKTSDIKGNYLYTLIDTVHTTLTPLNQSIIVLSYDNESDIKFYVFDTNCDSGDCSIQSSAGQTDLMVCFKQERESKKISNDQDMFRIDSNIYFTNKQSCLKCDIKFFDNFEIAINTSYEVFTPITPTLITTTPFDIKTTVATTEDDSPIMKPQIDPENLKSSTIPRSIQIILCLILFVAFAISAYFIIKFCLNKTRQRRSFIYQKRERNENLYLDENLRKQEPVIEEGNKLINLLIDSEILIHESSIEKLDKIGSGHFGSVYIGHYKLPNLNFLKVAIKTIDIMTIGNDILEIRKASESILEEAIVMKDFKHENVLSLIGVCLKPKSLPLIIVPFMARGSLLDYIRSEDNKPTVEFLLNCAIDAGNGMTYLSSLKYVHRDLAARNCMLDESLRVKVGDFGLTKSIYEQNYYRLKKEACLPFKWMAPECFTTGITTVESDVWSYGVLLWEMMTRGHIPYPENYHILDYLNEGHRLPKPETCPIEIYDIMLDCWNIRPKLRPSFEQIVKRIKQEISNYHQSECNTDLTNSNEYVNHCASRYNDSNQPVDYVSILN